MGYYLQTFICKQDDAGLLTNHLDKALRVDLDQGLCLIPMTEELFDQINNFEQSNSIDRFEFLTDRIETRVLQLIEDNKVAYVETAYFGGQGGQIAIIWNNNKRDKSLAFGQGRINEILKDFGVLAEKGLDEFTTLGFGIKRHTRDWLENTD